PLFAYFSTCHVDHRALHSFPTRRSSDLGVDPYYLTHKAQEIGYHPEMILAGRRLNDNMPLYVAGEVVKLMTSKRIHVKGARILRSEEHTSELQSRENLVCRLLLEKKKGT